MLQKEDLEAVIMAPPLWAHADLAVGCLDAGKHVLCEKMMALDVASCERMRAAAAQKRQSARDRLSALSTTRCIRPPTTASSRPACSATSITSRLAWHRNGNWRRKGDPPVARLRPVEVGLSRLRSPAQLAPLLEVLAGPDGRALQPPDQRRQLVPRIARRKRSSPRAASIVFLKATARSTITSTRPSIIRAGGRRVLLDRVERLRRLLRDVHGHKGTLILSREHDALLFEEGSAATRPTAVEISPRTAGPAAQSSETHERQHQAGEARRRRRTVAGQPNFASTAPAS